MAAMVQMTSHCVLSGYHIKWQKFYRKPGQAGDALSCRSRYQTACPSFQEQVALLRFQLAGGVVTDQIQNHGGLHRVFQC